MANFKEIKETNFPRLEAEVLSFWKTREIFGKSTQKPAPQGEYVFYEGPPTANGQPAMHHVLARAFKDLFPRYKSMQGFHVTRKGGWDTHGLPVEIAVEKRLGTLGRKALNRDQIAEFNATCKQYVFENIQDWNTFTERMAYWVDLDDAYITYDNAYIESVWNLLKRMWAKGIVIRDYKVVPLSPRISTTLSANEIAEGYREVDDPSIYVRFPLKLETTPPKITEALKLQNVELANLENLAILIWTTTPWTIPSNTMAAVNAEMTYALVKSESFGHIILAEEAVERVSAVLKEEWNVIASLRGIDMEWWEYTPPFPEVCTELEVVAHQGAKQQDGKPIMHFVALADFVSAADGSGVAHEAPVYGAEDLELARKYNVPLLFGTNEYGIMQVTDESGKFFKDADKGLIRIMKERGNMLHAGQIRHRYPFHDRTGDPILYFARPSWYVKTSQFRDKLFARNEEINWVPNHIKHGRFGNWLKDNVDWAISRERYWGAPLPFWVSEDGTDYHCVGSVAELSKLCGRDLSEMDLHRPYVDDISFELNGKKYTRIPEVIDVWFESGAMPYAQWHLLLDETGTLEETTPQPGEGLDVFKSQYPADFICEAIDQTRGWFYSLHAISTLLYDSPAYKNVICLGHLLDEKGQKMSKSKGNVVEPIPTFDKYGADAVRWYVYTSGEPGDSKRFSERLVVEGMRGFLNTLWNVYGFFVLYANLDNPDLVNRPEPKSRPEMDRWLVARTQQLILEVTEKLDAYDAKNAGRALEQFVDELSNWFVRRGRRRFWKNDDAADQASAYATLYEALVTLTQLSAPFTPFLAESLWQNLVRNVDQNAAESVHLSQWPVSQTSLIDEVLLEQMQAVVKVVGLARSARSTSGVKTRIPLSRALVTAPTATGRLGLAHFESEIADELNVKKIEVLDFGEELLSYKVLPNLPLLGRKFGKKVPQIKAALEQIEGKFIAAAVKAGRSVEIGIDGENVSISGEELLLEAISPEGLSALEQDGYLAALDVNVTEDLLLEGLSRDIIRLIQQARKDAGFDISDRIALGFETSGKFATSFQTFSARISEETLTTHLVSGPLDGFEATLEDEDGAIKVWLQKA